MLRISPLILLPTVLAVVSNTAYGQDFHIYTKVYDEGARAGDRQASEAPVVARSLTLFHAGKAYDSIESIGEVVIIDFDPAKRHFIILSTRRELVTTVHFDQVKNLLRVAAKVTDESLAELEQSGEEVNRRVIRLQRFQKSPKFEQHFDETTRQLTLSSPFLNYEVECATPGHPGFVDAYLRYADWICRLNYVLHPGVLRPEPRIKLNEALREQKMIPTQVRLRADLSTPLTLRASHQIKWKLDRRDRNLIDNWEAMLNSKTTRHVSLQEYQQEVVPAVADDRR